MIPVSTWVQCRVLGLAILGTGLSAASTLCHLNNVKRARGCAVRPRAHITTRGGRAPNPWTGLGRVLPITPGSQLRHRDASLLPTRKETRQNVQPGLQRQTPYGQRAGPQQTHHDGGAGAFTHLRARDAGSNTGSAPASGLTSPP